MGWGRYLLLGDIGQQFDLNEQKAAIEQQKVELRRRRLNEEIAGGQIAALQRENDELRLYVAALIRLLVTKGAVTRDELNTIVAAIDAEDGQADGRYDGKLS